MFKRNLLVIGFAAALISCQAYAGTQQKVLKKVHVNKAADFDEVVGLQTYYGRIVSAMRIKDSVQRNFANLPSAKEVKNKEEIELTNGSKIRAEELQYLYVRRLAERNVTAAPEGREPSTDED